MSVIIDEPVTLSTPAGTIACNVFSRDAAGVEWWAEVDGWGAAGVRNTTYDRSGADGAEQGGWFAGVREVTIRGHHMAPTEQARLDADRALITAVWRTPVTVVVGDVQATGWVSEKPELDAFGCNSEWQIVVLCTDPAKYAVTEQSVMMQQVGALSTGLHWSDLHWSDLHWGAGGLSSLQRIAANVGTERAYPMVSIVGPVTNPSLYNTTTGALLRFLTTLAAGETLTVDTANNAVMLGGTSWDHTLDPIGGLPSDFHLAAGDNTVGYSADTLGTGTAATLVWRSAWV